MTQNLPAIQQKAKTIRDFLEKDNVKKQLAMALPRHLSVDRLLRVAMTSIRNNPRLLDCTQESIFACILGCAQLGLEPEPFLGQAYLVPYRKKVKGPGGKESYRMEAQLIPGYRGYIALARRSGEVKSVTSQVVYEKDQFKMSYGLVEVLEHIPVEGDRGNPKGAYVIFRYKDGSYSFDYMSKADIEKIRARSKSPVGGPWDTDWAEMAKKTVIRRHIKLVPLSVEIAQAVATEEYLQAGGAAVDLFLPSKEPTEAIEDTTTQDLAEFSQRLSDHDLDEGDPHLLAFLELKAKEHGVTLDEAKISAVVAWESFWDDFETYRGQFVSKEESAPVTTETEGKGGKGQRNSTLPLGGRRGQGGITKTQLEYLTKVPKDILVAAYDTCGVGRHVPLDELDYDTAEKLEQWCRKQ